VDIAMGIHLVKTVLILSKKFLLIVQNISTLLVQIFCTKQGLCSQAVMDDFGMFYCTFWKFNAIYCVQ